MARQGSERDFVDRDVKDCLDGYVACESYKDSTKWARVDVMERGMQAVPILVHGSSQTELKYPKNIYSQYEARVFDQAEIKGHWQSEEMKKFMKKVTGIIDEVVKDPDIMGEFVDDIHYFYRRDQVEEIEETEMVESLAFSDLVFTQNMRVSHIRWHPTINGISAMTVLENEDFPEYLRNSSKRSVMPNFVLIWSDAHPIFPQLLLRIPSDVMKFEWHPNEPDILVGGCLNGQVVAWDIGAYLLKLKTKQCIWKHEVVLSKVTDKLHIEEGFIPVLHWSAESRIESSHLFMVEDIMWLPKNVRFSVDSAYPRLNQDESIRQFITCSSSDLNILVWGFEPPPAGSTDLNEDVNPSSVVGSHGMDMDDSAGHRQKTRAPELSGWDRLRKHHLKGDKDAPDLRERRTMGIGKYKSLDQIWKPNS